MRKKRTTKTPNRDTFYAVWITVTRLLIRVKHPLNFMEKPFIKYVKYRSSFPGVYWKTISYGGSVGAISLS